LAVGAHPDDIEIGAGGTIAKHVQRGDEVNFLILTYGEASGNAGIRKKEAEMSAKILGVKSIRFGGFPDTKVPLSVETIHAIEEGMRKTNPDRIYAPSVADYHQDHRNVAYSVAAAARRIPQVLAMELPNAHLQFDPKYYVEIDNTMKIKEEAIKTFQSQSKKNYMTTAALKALAQYRGYLIGVRYAEAFEIVRMVER
jgi:LmbE family N-acetylglucosaminyl deacetylase